METTVFLITRQNSVQQILQGNFYKQFSTCYCSAIPPKQTFDRKTTTKNKLWPTKKACFLRDFILTLVRAILIKVIRKVYQ